MPGGNAGGAGFVMITYIADVEGFLGKPKAIFLFLEHSLHLLSTVSILLIFKKRLS